MSVTPVADAASVAAAARTSIGAGLAPLWVIVVFSNLPIYIALFVAPGIEPLYWFVVLFILTAVTLIRAGQSARDRDGLFLAALACYACLCLTWYMVQGGGDPVVLRGRLLGLAICGVSYLVFAASAAALQAARRALAFMVVMCVAVNIWDISHPFALVPSTSELVTVGRAAGLFLNPNQAGAALVAGFTLSVALVPRGWRFVFIALVIVGVGLTFSRAALLGLALAIFALMSGGGRTVSPRQVVAASILVVAFAWLAWELVSGELQQRLHIDPEVAMDRLLWILDPSGRADFSQEERIDLLERGWQQFLAAPVLGNGVGSTELWGARSSTHNEYVMLASDFGLIGLLVFPGIVLCAMGARLGRLTDATVTGLFLLFWGFFSHNVLSEYYLLITIAMVAALSRCEREVASEPTMSDALAA